MTDFRACILVVLCGFASRRAWERCLGGRCACRACFQRRSVESMGAMPIGQRHMFLEGSFFFPVALTVGKRGSRKIERESHLNVL